MPDNIETAKALLRKGIQLGDQDLIDMANQLLGNQVDDTGGNTPVVADFGPTYSYTCTNCNQSIDSDKPRKKCPSCKKLKLVERQVVVKRKTGTEDFVRKPKSGDTKQIRYNENGEPEGSYGRTEQIKITGNKFVDDFSLELGDREFDKKVNPNRIVTT